MSDQSCWSYIYHLDGRTNPNESFPSRDTFYSLNVILGFARLGRQAWEKDYDLPAMLQNLSERLFHQQVPPYAFGMALWASAELNVPLENQTAQKIRKFVCSRANWENFRAQDVGIILTGFAERSARGDTQYDQDAHDLFRFIKDRYFSKSGLFFDKARGFRRNFSSFATQTYLTTACYHYGTRFNNEEALAIADKATRKIMSLQGPQGEWPWFYYTPKGIVVDNYEVYAVHQAGMAALFLEFAEKRGVSGAREAIVKGFDWIFANNQLNKTMMMPEKGTTIRSIIRKGELYSKKKRMIRAIINGFMGCSGKYIDPEKLTLRLECRSYELGWALYSFGHRTDLPEIINNPAFTQAV